MRLFNMTGEQRYLDFASCIVSEGGASICNIFEIAYADKTDPYQYPVVKAYEMMSCFEGLLEYYRATGNEKHRETVIRFAKRVMNSDITIIGGAGCTHELFDHSAVRQTDTSYQGLMQETCVTVTWMKLCWQLLLLTGDPSFADAFEQTLYNAYLGSINTEKVVRSDVVKRELPSVDPVALPFDSYSNLLTGIRGRGIGGLKLMPDGHYYGCCACIGSAGTGLIGKTAVMLAQDGVVMNLYIPGTVTTMAPSGQPLTLHTATDYPAEGKIRITLQMERSERFSLKLRVPAWSRQTGLTVCGEAYQAAKGYVTVDRVWHGQDQLLLTLDMRTHVIHAPRNPRDLLMTWRNWALDISTPVVVEESPDARFHIALQRGPLVLARDARLGEDVDEPVEIACDSDGYVDAVISSTAAFDNQIELSIPQSGGSTFTVVDYASAGKTWSEDSKYGCWMPTGNSLET